jgi:hypothetical protein
VEAASAPLSGPGGRRPLRRGRGVAPEVVCGCRRFILAKSRLTFQKRQKELARIRKREDKKKRMAEKREDRAEEDLPKGPQIATTEDLVGLGLADPEELEAEEAEEAEEDAANEEDTARS